MIQRKQSLYLLLGSLTVAAPLYFRGWIQQMETGSPLVDTGIQVFAGIAALVGLAVIFLYNDRNRQFKATVVIQVLTLLVIVAVGSVLYLSRSLPGLSEVSVVSGNAGAVVFPIIAYVFFFLARRAIGKDIKLIKSMDRIR